MNKSGRSLAILAILAYKPICRLIFKGSSKKSQGQTLQSQPLRLPNCRMYNISLYLGHPPPTARLLDDLPSACTVGDAYQGSAGPSNVLEAEPSTPASRKSAGGSPLHFTISAVRNKLQCTAIGGRGSSASGRKADWTPNLEDPIEPCCIPSEQEQVKSATTMLQMDAKTAKTTGRQVTCGSVEVQQHTFEENIGSKENL